MTFLLNGLYLVLLTFVSPWLILRRLRYGRYRRGWSDRFFGQTKMAPESSSVVWLHAVSVGEVQVLRTLVEGLASQRPDLSLAISVSTDSGMELAEKLFSKHRVFFTPLDFSWSMRRTLLALRPKLIVLAELELWPNWLTIAEQLGCPVAVINGRLSERSFTGYSRFQPMVGRFLRKIDFVGAQSVSYASRFEKLGLPRERLVVTGNVKFDNAAGNRDAEQVLMRKQMLQLTGLNRILLAGSTQSPEEKIVLDMFAELSKRWPDIKLILVPRHAERFAEVAKQIAAIGLPWAQRSQCPVTVSDPNWRIFLGDSVGELRWWWGLAEIGFVGGSFGDRGGQNMIEPCAYGVATCFGPNTRNFSDIVKLLQEHNACAQLQSPEELGPWIESMLEDPARRNEMAQRARSVCQTHRGATQRTWEHLQKMLPRPTTHPAATQSL